MGEFAVILELLEKLPGSKEGKVRPSHPIPSHPIPSTSIPSHPIPSHPKVLADKMIDICGTAPEGTGIQNLRKCIIRTKYK